MKWVSETSLAERDVFAGEVGLQSRRVSGALPPGVKAAGTAAASDPRDICCVLATDLCFTYIGAFLSNDNSA